MSKNIWVFCEQRDSELQSVALELLGAARELAAKTGEKVGALLLGENVTDKAQVTGGDVTQVPGTVLSNRAITWYQTGSYSIASGDVVIAPTADGFTFQLYYYDHNSQVIGGYAADCIKR